MDAGSIGCTHGSEKNYAINNYYNYNLLFCYVQHNYTERFHVRSANTVAYLFTSSPVLWLSKKAMSCRINDANKALRILSANLSPRQERNEM